MTKHLDSDRSAASTAARKAARSRLHWYQHVAWFAVGQGVLALLGYSWALAFFQNEIPDPQPWLMVAGRIWLVVFAVDTIWTWAMVLFRSTRQNPAVRRD